MYVYKNRYLGAPHVPAILLLLQLMVGYEEFKIQALRVCLTLFELGKSLPENLLGLTAKSQTACHDICVKMSVRKYQF